MNDKEFKWLNTRLKARIRRIELIRLAIESEQENNWQKNRTPIEIVDKMISKTNVMNKTILVLFNLEFIETLIYKHQVSPKKIFFFADHELEQMYAEKFYGVKTVLGNSELMKEKNKGDLHPLVKRILEMGQKKFDLVFSNPPYNTNIDIKIISVIEPLCKEMIVVHPSTWLLDLKGKYKPYNNFRQQLGNNLKSVELFNGNDVFSIQLEVPCMITHIDKNHKSGCFVTHEGEHYKAKSIDTITKFGIAWESIVNPFITKVKTYININSNIFEHRIKDVAEFENNNFFCQLTAVMNGFTKGQTKLADKFYSITMKNHVGNIGIRDYSPLRINLIEPSKPSFTFDTEKEVINFLKFCQSDFARFCLAIYKNSANLIYGEMTLIPWLDFTQEWDDKKLYKFFEINEETQKYIENFLPDYYGIRTKIEEKK